MTKLNVILVLTNREYIYKFIVVDVSKSEFESRQTANCEIKLSGDIDIAIGIFQIESDGSRAGFSTYFSPAREDEALGSNIEYNKDLTRGEYLLRTYSVNPDGSGKFKLKFGLTKNPDD